MCHKKVESHTARQSRLGFRFCKSNRDTSRRWKDIANKQENKQGINLGWRKRNEEIENLSRTRWEKKKVKRVTKLTIWEEAISGSIEEELRKGSKSKIAPLSTLEDLPFFVLF